MEPVLLHNRFLGFLPSQPSIQRGSSGPERIKEKATIFNDLQEKQLHFTLKTAELKAVYVDSANDMHVICNHKCK